MCLGVFLFGFILYGTLPSYLFNFIDYFLSYVGKFFFNFYFIFKLYITVLVLPNPILLTADLSAETLQARREWEDMFKVLKGKKIYNQDYCAQQGSHSKLMEK